MLLGTKIMSCHANKESETEKDLEDKFIGFSQPGIFFVCCLFSTIANDSRYTGRLRQKQPSFWNNNVHLIIISRSSIYY